MKKLIPKLKPGDIVVNHYGWQRLIRDIYIQGRGYKNTPTVCYSYFNEQIDSDYKATGKFNMLSIGFCSEAHLLQWGKIKEKAASEEPAA